MSFPGNIATSQILYFHFTTRQFSTGAPITSANLVMSVYKDDSTTQSTAGITTTFLTGFDNVVGLVSVKIDTSQDGTFYAAGHDFSVVVTTGTADSVSIVGEVVGYFSIQNRYQDKTGFALTSAYDPAKTAAQAGDAMALTAGERTTVSTAVWASATRTLSSFGTLVADVATAVWGAAARTLTAFGFTVDTNANATETSIKTQTDKLAFTVINQVDANIRSINDTTITGNGQPGTEFGV